MATGDESKGFYERLGGAVGVRAIVDRFYDLMDDERDASALRALHSASLVESREKLFEFLSGWLGGPPLYTEKRGQLSKLYGELRAAKKSSHGGILARYVDDKAFVAWARRLTY